VSVKARVDGQIVTVNFREGDPVKKNEVLFRVDPRPYEAALRQAEANALRDQAARRPGTLAGEALPGAARQEFRLEGGVRADPPRTRRPPRPPRERARRRLENARLNIEYCTIVSPLDGYVGKVLLQAGNMVRANDVNSLAVINQVRPIYVNFAVPEQSLPEVRQIPRRGSTRGRDRAGSGRAAGPGRAHLRRQRGRSDYRHHSLARPGFRTPTRALWPGQFVSVTLRLYDQIDAIIIPAPAVQNGPRGTVRLRRRAGSRRERPQDRRTCATDGERAIVTSGLKKGEQVVTRGQLRLGPKTGVQIGKTAEAS